MKYQFSISKHIDPYTGLEASNPLLKIENQEKYGQFFLDEIQNLSLNISYLKEVSQKLESLMSGKMLSYEGFGFEVYMIECDQKQARVINMQESESVVATIQIQEVYHLIKDWYKFVADFEENKHQKYSPKKITTDNSESFTLKEIEIPRSITNKEIYVGEINKKELVLTINLGMNQTLSFDVAAPVQKQIWPKRVSSQKQIKQITRMLDAEVSFSKKGTYNIRKQGAPYNFKTLYLSIGILGDQECLVSFYYEEKQPFVYLTYLNTVIQLDK